MIIYFILCGVILFLITFVVIKEIIYSRQIEKLTNKILARDYAEYSYANLEYEKELTKRKNKKQTEGYKPTRI